MNTINYSKLSMSNGLVYNQRFKHAIGKLNQFGTFTKFKEDSEKRAEILPEDKDKIEGNALKLQNFKQNSDTKDVGPKGQKGFGEISDNIFEVNHLATDSESSEDEFETQAKRSKIEEKKEIENETQDKKDLMDSFFIE